MVLVNIKIKMGKVDSCKLLDSEIAQDLDIWSNLKNADIALIKEKIEDGVKRGWFYDLPSLLQQIEIQNEKIERGIGCIDSDKDGLIKKNYQLISIIKGIMDKYPELRKTKACISSLEGLKKTVSGINGLINKNKLSNMDISKFLKLYEVDSLAEFHSVYLEDKNVLRGMCESEGNFSEFEFVYEQLYKAIKKLIERSKVPSVTTNKAIVG